MSSLKTSTKEYSIIIPKNVDRKYHVMRFNSTLGVEFDKWTSVKMERENNMKEFKGTIEEDQPKYGAGSEFGREAKEEARRKKLGIVPKKYKPEDQPWILKSTGSTVKKFKGIREGGVSENAAYYVFTHGTNNIIQAYPLNEWYKFQPIQRYKALSAEEAEQEFSKRNQHLNFFSLMLRKRLKGEDDAVIDGEADDSKSKGKKAGKSKELKISEMDEWMDSSDDDSDEEDAEKQEDEDDGKKKKKEKKTDLKKKKKKKRDTDQEAFEDSDDGDGEGRELDYITDSSDSEPENTKLEGVSEEKALRKLLNSDEEEDSDSEKEEKEEKEEEKEKSEEKEEKPKETSKTKKKKKDSKKDDKKDKKDDNSDFSSDSSTDEEAAAKKKAPPKSKKKKEDKPEEKVKVEKEVDSPNSSRSASPINDNQKRKLMDAALTGGSGTVPKKAKIDASNFIPGAAEAGITEDAVRKYLMRKPMTTTELLQKFKSKKTGLSSDRLVNIMTQILKRINPVKQMLKGKMYLSIKS